MNLSPDWVEAIGTWVGGAGTVGTLIYAGWALRHETERRRQDVDDLRKAERSAQDAQARAVVLHDPGCGGRQDLLIDTYEVTLGNYGAHPITNVVSELTHKESGAVMIESPGRRRIGPQPLAVLRGGLSQTLRWNLDGLEIKWPPGMDGHVVSGLFGLIVRFTDVHGIRWALRPGLGQQPARDYSET